jgi:hypothetical protein
MTGYWYDTPEGPSIDDPTGDLLAETVDKPCNTHAYFRINQGRLEMTVCNRSNDILWGAYGANAVHFSFLLEYMAAMLVVPVGKYYQMSNNYHLYTQVLSREKAETIIRECARCAANLDAVPLVENPRTFDTELQRFFDNPKDGDKIGYTSGYDNTFFNRVAHPMYRAWINRKDFPEAYNQVSQIQDVAWCIACTEWIQRREVKANG